MLTLVFTVLNYSRDILKIRFIQKYTTCTHMILDVLFLVSS